MVLLLTQTPEVDYLDLILILQVLGCLETTPRIRMQVVHLCLEQLLLTLIQEVGYLALTLTLV